MPQIFTWEDLGGWSLWAADAGDIRADADGLLLPTISPAAPAASDTLVCQYRFSEFHSSVSTPPTTDLTGNGRDILFPAGTTARAERDGFWSPNRASYGFVQIGSRDPGLDYPKEGLWFYASLWFRNELADYSAARGFLLIHHEDINPGNIGYSIYIDTDNVIKAELNDGSASVVVSSGASVKFQQWQHVCLIFGPPGDSWVQIVVDNDWAGSTLTAATLQPIGQGKHLSIGSASTATSYGFVGYIDELKMGSFTGPIVPRTDYKYGTATYLSPVVDTQINGSSLIGIRALYEKVSDPSIQFSFRASATSFAQTASSPAWSAFTSAGQIASGAVASAADLGLYIQGRYQQVRVRLTRSSDTLRTDSVLLTSLQLTTGASGRVMRIMATADPAYEPGVHLGQIVNFSGTKQISRVSVNLSTIGAQQSFFLSQNGTVVFPAADFVESRDPWVWQPVRNTTWQTSGATISPRYYTSGFPDAQLAVAYAPYLTYDVYLDQPGVYDIWCFGYAPNAAGMFWAWDDDTTDLRALSLPLGSASAPRWQKIGTINDPAGGLHTLTVYLGAVPSVCILDQWSLTTNRQVAELPLEELQKPWLNSDGPYMTILRASALVGGGINGWTANPSVAAWLSQVEIPASGKYHYLIQRDTARSPVSFTNGLALEFWQVGGGSQQFAAWQYTFSDTVSAGAHTSANSGSSYQQVRSVPASVTPPSHPDEGEGGSGGSGGTGGAGTPGESETSAT